MKPLLGPARMRIRCAMGCVALLSVFYMDRGKVSAQPQPTVEELVTDGESTGEQEQRSFDPGEIFLDDVVRVDFVPSQVFFLVSFDSSSYFRKEATLSPPFRSEDRVQDFGARKAAGPSVWRAGVRVKLPSGVRSVVYSVIVVGEGGRFALIPPRSASTAEEQSFGGQIELLRAQLIRRKQEARSWQTQVDAQEDSLRRLRADADVIADLGRIVEVREDVDKVRVATEGLRQDQRNLEKFVVLVRALPPPRNFSSRERQLTKHIAELADVAKSTEGGEFARRAEAEREVQRKLEVVEQARGLDVDELQRALVQLRKRRIDLESSNPG